MRFAWLLLVTACASTPAVSPAPDCRTVSRSNPLASAHDVRPLYATQSGKAGPTNRLLGATVVVDAQAGQSQELLQHEIDCSEPAPLGVQGARAIVAHGEGAFRVAITSDDSDEAEEILRRATALPR